VVVVGVSVHFNHMSSLYAHLHGNRKIMHNGQEKNCKQETCAPCWSSIATMTASPVMHAQCSGNNVPCSLFTSAPCSSRCATSSSPWSASCQWLMARISRSDRSYDCWALSRMYHIDGRANGIAKSMHLHSNTAINCNHTCTHIYRKTSNKCREHLLEHGHQNPAFNREPAFIGDPAFIRILASSLLRLLMSFVPMFPVYVNLTLYINQSINLDF